MAILPFGEKPLISTLTTSSYARVSQLLDFGLSLGTQEREQWLKELELTDPRLVPILQRLLGNQEEVAATTLERPPLLAPSVSIIRKVTKRELKAGAHIAHYVLERELGRGGMAEVWLARRSDGTLNRPVALKLPFTSEFDQRLLPRFSRERDILARLDHPNIARLYDAGADGLTPFLAIEWVQGQTITRYCEAGRLSLEQRLELFCQVLDAVQYAHTHLVVHRDIKPSNILVTKEGQVKLLDFGIAKPTELDGQEDPLATALTREAGRVLTISYASPEQVRGESVSIVSDVYSLGVVLYELLTGLAPYATLRQDKSTLTPQQREAAVISEEPGRPSASPITQHFVESMDASPKFLKRKLADGLDAVLLTALAKDKDRRYATVAAMRADLKAWLAGMPLQAQVPSAAYVFKKFVLRHRLAVAVVSIGLIAIMISAGTALWQAREARKAARVTQEVKSFLINVLAVNSGRNNGELNALASQRTTAAQLLRQAVTKIKTNFAMDLPLRAELLGVMGDLTHEMHLNADAIQLREQQLDIVDNQNDKLDILLALIDSHFQAGDSEKVMVILTKAKHLISNLNPSERTVFEARLQWREARLLEFTAQFEPAAKLLAVATATLKNQSHLTGEWLQAERLRLSTLVFLEPQVSLAGFDSFLKQQEQRVGPNAPALIPILQDYANAAARADQTDLATRLFLRLESMHAASPDFDPVGAAVDIANHAFMLGEGGQLFRNKAMLSKAQAAFEKAGLSNNPGVPTMVRAGVAINASEDWDFDMADQLFSSVEQTWLMAKRERQAGSIYELHALQSGLRNNTEVAREQLAKARQFIGDQVPADHPIRLSLHATEALIEGLSGSSRASKAAYEALASVPKPVESGPLKLAWFSVQTLGVRALGANQQWQQVISRGPQIASQLGASAADRVNLARIELEIARAHIALAQWDQAKRVLDQSQDRLDALGVDALLPLKAEVALQKCLWANGSGQNSRVKESASKEFFAYRKLLKGESFAFKLAADSIR
jgi:serine/threonine protein kinase